MGGAMLSVTIDNRLNQSYIIETGIAQRSNDQTLNHGLARKEEGN